MRSVIGLIVVGLLVSGCTGTSAPPTPTKPTSTAQSGPVDMDQSTRQRLAENSVYRTWDTCALHDPEAIKKVFGGEFELLEPETLDQCVARVKRPDLGTFAVYTYVGAPFFAQDEAKAEIGGKTFLSDSKDNTSCSWHYLTSKQSAITLRITYSGGVDSKQPPKPACEFGKDYLATLAPIWSNPPLRSEGATEPAIALAGKDPCATYEELAKLLPQGGEKPQLMVPSPYACVVRLPVRSKTGSSGFDVRFLFADDPVAAAQRTPGQYKPVQIEGKPGTVQQRKGECTINVQAEETSIPGLNEEVPVIRLTAPDCQQAETAAKIVTKAALS
ncbi:hypothetical protein [Crossiella sp. CA198]|uniref:hypothetical protein n=1 Tax=Crossiella sp. CA198 TaxID=3455607 RepID=UPI003F8D27AF